MFVCFHVPIDITTEKRGKECLGARLPLSMYYFYLELILPPNGDKAGCVGRTCTFS